MDYIRQRFLHPRRAYTPFPFWFWNDQLNQAEIIRQISSFQEHGIDGFIIHPRMGLPETIPYLSDVFLDYVETAVEAAAERGMKVILYDEGMYPSGSAHGMVVAESPDYASKGLKRIPLVWQQLPLLTQSQRLVWKNGREAFIQVPSGGHIRGIHPGEDDRQPNAPASADLLNPRATAAFLRLTHERYYQRLQNYFGSTVTGMFTDEPSIMGRGFQKGLIPWSDGLLDEYIESGGSPEELPLLWDEGTPERERYLDLLNRRLEHCFYRPISNWCRDHGIALIGHPAESDNIGLLHHFQIPGQDVVLRMVSPEEGRGLEGKHSTQAKCTSDSARHLGKRRNANECFGACCRDQIPWNFSADDLKWYLDWLFVRGVNLIIPHAFYYSIRGDRGMERPPDVGPNNLWWDSWKQISSYIKRMCYLLTDSYNTAHIAVLCKERGLPWKQVKPLFQNQIEFNYLEEALLDQCRAENGQLFLRDQVYDALAGEALPSHPVIDEYLRQGGTVLGLDPPLESLTRDVLLDTAEPDLRFTHLVKDRLHLYLFTNEGEDLIETQVHLNHSGRCELWNPWEGTAAPASCAEKDGWLEVSLRLPRRESLVFAVDSSKRTERLRQTELRPGRRIPIRGEWSLDGRPAAERVSWTELGDLAHFSGTLTYRTDFECPEVGERADLVLTGIHDTASVRLNGTGSGTRLWAPFVYDITSPLRRGTNRLEITVCNSMANRMSQAGLASGFLGEAYCQFYEAT